MHGTMTLKIPRMHVHSTQATLLYQDQSFIQRLDTIVGYRFLLVRGCGLQDMRGAYSVCLQIPVFHITYLLAILTLVLVTLVPIQQTCDENFFQYDIACLTILYRPSQFVR